MIRNIFIFLATFAVGALVAFVARAALHKPHTVVGEHRAPESAPMVGNALTSASVASKPDPAHAGHDMSAASKAPVAAPAESTAGPVNTVCAICGMKVDPNVPTLEYQGKKIGFGCKMCEPKFKADPDKYGPIYLRNEVIKR